MRKNQLWRGEVYAWPGFSTRKVVFANLDTPYEATENRQRRNDGYGYELTSKVTYKPSPDGGYWGRFNTMLGGNVPERRRGFLAAVGTQDDDDDELRNRADAWAQHVAEFTGDDGEPRAFNRSGDIIGSCGWTVVAPREVTSTWADHVAEKRAEREAREQQRRREQEQDAARAAHVATIEAIAGPLPDRLHMERHDRLVVSAAWLADVLTRIAYQEALQ